MLVSLMVLFFSANSFAQINNTPIQPNNLKTLQQFEDSLRIFSDSMVFADDDGLRSDACFSFIKKLVTALKTPQSYAYHFDSLKTISIAYSPDNQFRFITWGLLKHTGGYRFYGAIQMNTPKLQLFSLFDYSPLIRNFEDTICTKDSWYGCMYYNIVPKIVGTKTYYTVFGWKAYNSRTMRKVMDILYFDEDKKPVFGAPIIFVNKDNKPKTLKRFVIEYNKKISASLNYDDEMKMVVFDHLVSKQEMEGKPEKPGKTKGYDLYPDGTYEAFEWKNNVSSKNSLTPVPFFDNQKSSGYMKTKTIQVPDKK
jgi:hypothetical protein